MTKKEIRRWAKRNLGVVPTIDRTRGRWRFRAVLRRSFRESQAGKPVVVPKYLKLEVRCPTLRGLHVELVDGCRKHPETQIPPRAVAPANPGDNRHERRAEASRQRRGVTPEALPPAARLRAPNVRRPASLLVAADAEFCRAAAVALACERSPERRRDPGKRYICKGKVMR